MSRPRRVFRKKYIVFCEGDTEYHYVDSMRGKQGVELALKPINMGGGGYSSFLERIKVESKNNCLAKFVIVDLDRYKNIPGEEAKFKELIEYCKLQNKNGTVPHFLIIDNPDFEYVACLHISEYKGQNVKNYIESVLGFGTVEKFKAKKDIYQYLNSNKNSYSVMLKRIKENDKFIQNVFSVHKNRMEIVISKTNIEWDNLNARGSNIDEFFSILEW